MIQKRSTYIGIAIFLVIIVFAACWFLWYSPNKVTREEHEADRAAAEIKNDALEREVQQLRIDFEKLPEYKAELDEYRIGIPTEANMDEAIAELTTIAANHSVTLTGISAAPAVEVPTEASQPIIDGANEMAGEALEPTTSASPTPSPSATSTSPTPSPSATSTSPPLLTGFHAIQQQTTVLGTYDNVMAFIEELQTTAQRHYLIPEVQFRAETQAAASQQKPATNRGDVEVTLPITLYVLEKTPEALAFETPAPDATPDAVPPAAPGKNPWQQNNDNN